MQPAFVEDVTRLMPSCCAVTRLELGQKTTTFPSVARTTRMGSKRLMFLYLLLKNHLGRTSPGSEFSEQFYQQIRPMEIEIPDYILRRSHLSKVKCAALCSRTSPCRSFGFGGENSTCRLYSYPVRYTTLGLSAPGTRYYWLLSPRCPTELGYTLGPRTCFRLLAQWKNRTMAEAICRDSQEYLFVGNTEDKLVFLHSLAPSATMWLGASDEEEEGVWRWVDGSSLPLTWHLWKPMQPDNDQGEQHYLVVRSAGDLDDFKASPNCRVVCEIPLLN